jgi:hypothetical protein
MKIKDTRGFAGDACYDSMNIVDEAAARDLLQRKCEALNRLKKYLWAHFFPRRGNRER